MRYYTLFKWIAILIMLSAVPSISRAAVINSLTANTSTVGRYEKYELTFNLTGVSPSDYNPFRWETFGDSLSPAGIDARAEVITPSGTVKTVYGFYDVDLAYLGEYSNNTRYERFVPMSGTHWHVRYAPEELGAYKITVKVADAAGTVSSSQLVFNCVDSDKKGFVKVSSDGTRLAYSDGTPFVPFGMMIPYGTGNVAPAMADMKANGINFVRKWLVNRDKDDIFREFEGWYSYTADTSMFRTGKRSAAKTVTGTGTVVDQSFIGCKPSTYYKAYAYIKTSSSFNGQVAVNVNEDGKGVSTISHAGTGIGANQNWALSQVIFKTGSTAEMFHFKSRILSGSSGNVWVDDVGLYECDSAGNVTVNYNMVFNPSFEEWTPAQLRMIPLARFEYLLQQCEENGIVVQPAFFDYRLWNTTDPIGFYAQFFGDWWTDTASTAQQDRVLRYIVARFGHYRSLFAWELTNEMDSSYTDARGNWVASRSRFIQAHDPYKHPVTNSLWNSPGDYEYAQLPEMGLNQVHHYMFTEENTQGFPSWGTLSSGMSIDTNSSNAASGSRSLKASANGGTISQSATVYGQPNRSYTLRCKIKTSGVTGQASVTIRPFGGSSAGSAKSVSSAGTTGYTALTASITTGSSAIGLIVQPQLTGSSGTAWWDDIEVIDNSTGRPVLYNGGFESVPLGDDEFEWARFYTLYDQQTYESGVNGTKKPWASGETGLMGADWDLSYWARYNDTTKPRHDSTGIHVHNGIWAQLVASSALNTPVHWWVNEYIMPYDLYGVWKGASSFAAVLPFYDRGQLVSTDECAEVRASSSNAKIRLLGQKKSDCGYFWIQNSDNTWSKVIRGGQTPSAAGATLTIPGFEDGSYAVKWFDTYTGQQTRTEYTIVSGGALKLSVSSLLTDTAAIAEKEQTQPQVSLTLVIDKNSASPTEIVTYTLQYTNKGTGNAANVEITLPIPANTTYIGGSVSGGGTYDQAANCVRWVIPSLVPGASGQYTARVSVN